MSSKAREALKEMLEIASPISTGDDDDPVERIAQIAEAALAEPLRNCDFGTAEEQTERHDKYCERFIAEGCGASTNDCIACFARWAQMPYEEAK